MLIVGYDGAKINKLKKDLSKFFDMKDLGPVEQILGMKTACDRKAKKLWLLQEKYVKRVIKQFNMENAKLACTPLANHFKLSKSLVLLQGTKWKRWQQSHTHLRLAF